MSARWNETANRQLLEAAAELSNWTGGRALDFAPNDGIKDLLEVLRAMDTALAHFRDADPAAADILDGMDWGAHFEELEDDG